MVVLAQPILKSMRSAEFWRKVPRFLRNTLVIVGGYALVTGAIAWLSNRFEHVVNIVMIVLFCVLGAVLCYMVVRELLRLWRDRTRLAKMKRSTVATRASIAGDLLELETQRSRVKYVQWLRETQVQPRGEWPHGRPNTGDAASTMLA